MGGSVSFHYHEITFKLPNPRKTRDWIQRVTKKEKHQIESINFIFCSDEFLFGLNRKYLKHDTYTDILTFDYSTEIGLVADIYISIERVRDNATRMKVDFDQELRRVMIHGILHLTGHPDKTSSQKASMRKKEEACLSLFDKN